MASKDDYKFAAVRNLLLDAVRKDLLGPSDGENEIITDNPSTKYITGILFPPENGENDKDLIPLVEESDFVPLASSEIPEQDGDDESQSEKSANVYQKPSSIGLSFYLDSKVLLLKIKIRYGTYAELPKEDENEKGKKFQRSQHEEILELDFPNKSFKSEKKLSSNEKLSVVAICRKIKNGNRSATVFLQNKNNSKEAQWKRAIYQAELEISSLDKSDIFLAESECRKNLPDEYFYSSRPVFARGRQCAAVWEYKNQNKKTSKIKSSFIPEYEIPAIDYQIPELPGNALSMFEMGSRKSKNQTIQNLNLLATLYEKWIEEKESDGKNGLKNDEEKQEKITQKCKTVSARMRRGIELLKNDGKAFDAFLFMNQTMYMQQAVSDHCKNYSQETHHKLEASLEKLKSESKWRPFQIAFILLNLYGIVHKESEEREIVDLLFFPTGGGKTEAYLGLIAFTTAYRRLSAGEENFYSKDGGVTVILRYTLRLLTMQQRDRLLKLVVAMEMMRSNHPEKYGNERISIGFWVGGGVTPNRFSEYNEANQWDKRQFEEKIQRQILKCPFCGKPLEKNDFSIISKAKTIQITCSNPDCYFYKSSDSKSWKTIPVYVVDEEIYAKCPTILISTVDKFARLPWTEETALLFGKTNCKCGRCGYIALGSDRHPQKSHEADRFYKLPKAEVVSCKPFYPPELIIQDELHLITGPLGTIYGGFETVVEDMCSVQSQSQNQNSQNEKKILPKYIASTATIKNAESQIQKLYGRKKFCQFPPSVFDMSDSYFVNEIPLPSEYPDFDDDEKIGLHIKKREKPFRMYASVCAPGVSMKIAEVRLYAALLSKVFELSQNEKYKNYVDPYFTLIGYFNSLRELGGSVRLLNDEIPGRLLYLKNLHKMEKQRFLNNIKELTSRVPSEEIASVLENLSIKYNPDEKYQKAYDVVVATNMIAVGMDVDRLALMCVSGQPKQNAEFIQATSRVGRKFPGLIFTLDNPYKPRDLSVYENFTGFHSQMSRYVEGNSVTPFSARARDRDLHSLVVSLVRFHLERLAANKGASQIDSITEEENKKIKRIILERIKSVESDACEGAKQEIDEIFSKWKNAAEKKNLFYSLPTLKEGQKRLLAVYGSEHINKGEFETLNSMRDVEPASTMYLWKNVDEEDEESDLNQGAEK